MRSASFQTVKSPLNVFIRTDALRYYPPTRSKRPIRHTSINVPPAPAKLGRPFIYGNPHTHTTTVQAQHLKVHGCT